MKVLSVENLIIPCSSLAIVPYSQESLMRSPTALTPILYLPWILLHPYILSVSIFIGILLSFHKKLEKMRVGSARLKKAS